jgi:hypothetical protein
LLESPLIMDLLSRTGEECTGSISPPVPTQPESDTPNPNLAPSRPRGWLIVAWLVITRPILPLEEADCSRGLKILSGVASVVTLVQLARLAVFMIDPSQINYSFVPSSKWEVEHSCLSAYFVSAQASSSGQDIYDDSLFTMPDDVPTQPRVLSLVHDSHATAAQSLDDAIVEYCFADHRYLGGASNELPASKQQSSGNSVVQDRGHKIGDRLRIHG